MMPGAGWARAALAVCCAVLGLGSEAAETAAAAGEMKAAAAREMIALANPGFESAKPGMHGNPEGWLSTQHAGALSYTFKLDAAVHHSGSQSLRVDNVGPEPFGSIYQQIAAAAHRGKRLRLSAWLRTRDTHGNPGGGGGAGLLIQAMQGGALLAWNHMRDAAVRGSRDWQRYSIELDVPASADQLEVGAMLQGPGSLWLDDVELEAVR